MADDETRQWILDQYAAGHTPEQLKASLTRSGHDPGLVEEVLGTAGEQSLPPPPPAKQKKQFPWTIVIVVMIMAAFIVGLIFFSRVIGSLLTSVPTT